MLPAVPWQIRFLGANTDTVRRGETEPNASRPSALSRRCSTVNAQLRKTMYGTRTYCLLELGEAARYLFKGQADLTASMASNS